MSLRIWLPLTKDLRNQGLDDVTVTNNGATFNANGKLGGCYKTSNSGDMDLKYSGAQINTGSLSLCGWFKFNKAELAAIWEGYSFNSTYPNPTGNLIGNNSYGGVGLIWSTNSLVSGAAFTSLYVVCAIRSTTNGARATSNVTIPFDTWVHLALVFNKDTKVLELWLNGELKATSTMLDFNDAKTDNLKLNYRAVWGGNGPSYNIPFLVNDVRIYDHALSPLEVKQISQGLILHYPLNNVIGGLPRLWSLASYTRSIDLTTSYAYIYSIPNNTVWLTPGKQYTVAAEVKVNQNNILFYFDSNCTDANGVYSGNDAAQTIQYNPVVNLEKDKWVPVYITTTIKNDAGKPYYHHGFLFRTNSGILTTNCEIRNIEVYEGNLKLCRGLLPTDNIEYDCSGFENNGTRTGTFSWTSDTPKYNVSQYFNNSTGTSTLSDKIYISASPNLYSPSAITVGFWFKKEAITRGGLFTTGPATTSTTILAIHDYDSGVKVISSDNTTLSMGSYDTFIPSTNIWYYYVITFDGINAKIYINGDLKTIKSYSGTKTLQNIIDITLGANSAGGVYRSTKGYYSDFRIYATALSAEDVKSLYQNSAYIDNQGNIYGAVYEEV